MKVQTVFYVIGIIFIFASVSYFSYEFLFKLPDTIKFVLLIVATVVSFISAELLRGGNI